MTVDLPRQQQQPSFKLKKGKQNKKQQIRKLKTNQQKPKKKQTTTYDIVFNIYFEIHAKEAVIVYA